MVAEIGLKYLNDYSLFCRVCILQMNLQMSIKHKCDVKKSHFLLLVSLHEMLDD